MSPVRPQQVIDKALSVSRIGKSGTAFTEGCAVKVTATAGEVDLAGAGDKVYGIMLGPAFTGDGVKPLTVVLDNGIVPVKVGTGGATYGTEAIAAADGLTDKTLGGGTVVKYIAGTFEETGVVGDLVGLRVKPYASVSA